MTNIADDDSAGNDTAFIPVTQYLFPHGRQREESIKRPREIADLAFKCIDAGMRFEAEVLTTGHVSLTVVGEDADGEECDLAVRVCQNGPAVVDAFDALTREAFRILEARGHD